MSKLSEALDRIEELEARLESLEPVAAERREASIVIEWIDYPGLSVGLDAGGNAVIVKFDDCLHGWDVELYE